AAYEIVTGLESRRVLFRSSQVGMYGWFIDNIRIYACVGVTLSKDTVSVAESGASESYTVVLDSQPGSDVTIAISTGGQVTVSPRSEERRGGNGATTRRLHS